MKFVSVRDLRLKPGKVWKMAKEERDVVLTVNGRPVAILTGVDEDSFEAEVEAIRRARALQALESLQHALAPERDPSDHRGQNRSRDPRCQEIRGETGLRVVVDTNVVISAFLKPGGKPSRVLRSSSKGIWRSS